MSSREQQPVTPPAVLSIIFRFFKPRPLTIILFGIFTAIAATGYYQNETAYIYYNTGDPGYYPAFYYVWLWLAWPLIVAQMGLHFALALDQVSWYEPAASLYRWLPTIIYSYVVSSILAYAARRARGGLKTYYNI